MVLSQVTSLNEQPRPVSALVVMVVLYTHLLLIQSILTVPAVVPLPSGVTRAPSLARIAFQAVLLAERSQLLSAASLSAMI